MREILVRHNREFRGENKIGRKMKDIKPEMHDIGKLIDSSMIKHNFENYPGNLEGAPPIKMNAIWEGILQHHCSKDFKEYPKSFETFVLSIADSVASATSRHIKVKGEPPRYNIYKLWNPPDSNIHELSKVIKKDTSSINWISKIVEFINKNPSVDEFLKFFGKYLKARTEDATPGSNITSLWTHSKLTGLFYNLLYDYLENVSNKWFKVATKDEIGDYIRRVREETKIKIVKIRIIFPQHPVRIRDLNIFDVLKEVKKEILKKYPNNVIFVGFNELLLILPLNKKLEEMREIVSKYGFWFEYVERVQNLDRPYPDPDRVIRLISKMQKIQYKKFKERIAKVPPDKRKKAEEGIKKQYLRREKRQKE